MGASSIETVDVAYLERAAALLAGPKEAGLRIAGRVGASVLDVGCGPGLDTLELAHRVGITGRVDGVDIDPVMVDAANRRAVAAGVAHRVAHHQAPADALPFADATFDVVRAERLLQHTSDPAAVVTEMVRVLEPGGTLVLVDTDWASLSFVGDRPMERRIVDELQSLLPNPTAGRDLRALLAGAGCETVEVEPYALAFTDLDLARFIAQLPVVEQRLVALGRADGAEADRWRAACERLDGIGGFYGHAIMTVAVGRRPR